VWVKRRPHDIDHYGLGEYGKGCNANGAFDPLGKAIWIAGGTYTPQRTYIMRVDLATDGYAYYPAIPTSHTSCRTIFDPLARRLVFYNTPRSNRSVKFGIFDLRRNKFGWQPFKGARGFQTYQPPGVYVPELKGILVHHGRGIKGENYKCDPVGRTWLFDLGSATWSELASGKETPPPVNGAGFVYDALNKVCIYQGGAKGKKDSWTWVFDPKAKKWTNMKPVGALGRPWQSAMAYDPEHNLAVFFKGYPTRAVWVYRYKNVPEGTKATVWKP
ncbi:MAG: Kelch repeat-containing protein, partial [Planctomycetota bacterium]